MNEKTNSENWFNKIFPDNSIIETIFSFENIKLGIRITISVIISIIVVSIILAIIKRVAKKRLDARSNALVVRIAKYIGIAIISINALEMAKVDLSALLGAAGIAGIAIGFAAQTSVSNFISGFFLMSEKMFTKGDMLTVDSTTGIVYSVDTLSIKLRTFDNQLVRIPNETLIKATVTNVTHFSLRRLNIQFTINYGDNINSTKTLLYEIAQANQYVLKNPEPFFSILDMNERGVGILFGVWVENDNWTQANNSLKDEIINLFKANDLHFAYPAITLYPDTSSKKKTL